MHNDEFKRMNTPRVSFLVEDEIDFNKYLIDTEPQEKVKRAHEYVNGVMHILAPAESEPKNPKIPFKDCWLYFNPGEVTIWGGYNNSGKSMLQGQILTELAEAGEKVCIASLEMKPARTLARICRQMSGKRIPTLADVSDILGRNNGRLWLYDQQGTVKPDRMIAVIKYCAETLGCQHIAVDSLMKCIAGTKDYDAQKDFVDRLTVAARDFNTHIHLVAHMKKPESGDALPGRYSIKGASEISDLVDNIVIVWRNEKKESDKDAGKEVDDRQISDALLIVDKARNGEWEGRIPLWHDKSSMKFFDFYKQRGIL